MIRTFRAFDPRSIQLVIFDLDGTLIDSRLDLVHSVNAALRHIGRPELPDDVIASYVGDGAPVLIQRALGGEEVDEALVRKGLEFFLSYYRAHKLDHTTVYPGVAAALGQFFSQVYGGNSFSTKKPDPEGARRLLEEYGVQPQQAAIIGDSHVDVNTGRNAGMVTVGVTYGFAPHTLQDEPPDVLVDHPSELPLLFATP
jgi:phosphoglycolate phosphatase